MFKKACLVVSLISLSAVHAEETDKAIGKVIVGSAGIQGAAIGLDVSTKSEVGGRLKSLDGNISIGAVVRKDGSGSYPVGQAGISYTTSDDVRYAAITRLDPALIYSDGTNYFFGSSPIALGIGKMGPNGKITFSPKLFGTGQFKGEFEVAGGVQISGDLQISDKAKAQGFVLVGINGNDSAVLFGKVSLTYDIAKYISLVGGLNVSAFSGARTSGKDVQEQKANLSTVGGEAGLAFRM